VITFTCPACLKEVSDKRPDINEFSTKMAKFTCPDCSQVTHFIVTLYAVTSVTQEQFEMMFTIDGSKAHSKATIEA